MSGKQCLRDYPAGVVLPVKKFFDDAADAELKSRFRLLTVLIANDEAEGRFQEETMTCEFQAHENRFIRKRLTSQGLGRLIQKNLL